MTDPVRRLTMLAAIGVLLVCLVACGLWLLGWQPVGLADATRLAVFVTGLCLAGGLWLFAVAIVRSGRLPPHTIWLVLGIAVAMRLMTLTAPPILSSDIYRYVWDGRVQLAGINPYRYVPARRSARISARRGGVSEHQPRRHMRPRFIRPRHRRSSRWLPSQRRACSA